MGLLEDFAENWQRDAGQNRDNDDDDEQFDEGKGGGFLHGREGLRAAQ
jgi:hypothetical protein